MLQLFKFKGGVKPDPNKTPSQQQPIARAPLPPLLIVPLHQSIGGMPTPLVEAGDYVLKGQRIGGADKWLSSAVHAPSSGTVVAVEERVAAHPSGLPTLCVVIATDGRDEWIERTPVDYRELAPERVRENGRQVSLLRTRSASQALIVPTVRQASAPPASAIGA